MGIREGLPDLLPGAHAGTRRSEPVVTVSRYLFQARAWWGRTMVADSDSCLCIEEEGQPATLYFPDSDIKLGLSTLRATGTRVP